MLRLTRKHSTISLIGIGAQNSHKTKGQSNFVIRSLFNENVEFSITAHILSKLTSLPTVEIQKQNWPHLNRLTLADNYTSPGPIDLILGTDV